MWERNWMKFPDATPILCRTPANTASSYWHIMRRNLNGSVFKAMYSFVSFLLFFIFLYIHRSATPFSVSPCRIPRRLPCFQAKGPSRGGKKSTCLLSASPHRKGTLTSWRRLNNNSRLKSRIPKTRTQEGPVFIGFLEHLGAACFSKLSMDWSRVP